MNVQLQNPSQEETNAPWPLEALMSCLMDCRDWAGRNQLSGVSGARYCDMTSAPSWSDEIKQLMPRRASGQCQRFAAGLSLIVAE